MILGDAARDEAARVVERLVFRGNAAALRIVIRGQPLLQEGVLLQVVVEAVGAADAVAHPVHVRGGAEKVRRVRGIVVAGQVGNEAPPAPGDGRLQPVAETRRPVAGEGLQRMCGRIPFGPEVGLDAIGRATRGRTGSPPPKWVG